MESMSTLIHQSKEELQQEAERLGFQYEKDAHYCPQATLAAIMDVLHFSDDALFKSCFGFHGGGGDTNNGPCGALVGGILAICWFFGRTKTEFDLQIDNYQASGIVRKLQEMFEQEFGSFRCRDIHTCLFGRDFDIWSEEGLRDFLEAGAHDDRCPSVVGKGAAWAVGLIIDEMRRPGRIARRKLGD
jgi:hypothetical protein